MALVLLVVASGCGESRVVKVTGRLTYKDRAVPNVWVSFHHEDGSRASRGKTGEDGTFTLKYTKHELGAVRGRHNVSLEYDPRAEEEGKPSPIDAETRKALARYADSSTSGLQYEVTHDGQVIEINLP